MRRARAAGLLLPIVLAASGCASFGPPDWPSDASPELQACIDRAVGGADVVAVHAQVPKPIIAGSRLAGNLDVRFASGASHQARFDGGGCASVAVSERGPATLRVHLTEVHDGCGFIPFWGAQESFDYDGGRLAFELQLRNTGHADPGWAFGPEPTDVVLEASPREGIAPYNVTVRVASPTGPDVHWRVHLQEAAPGGATRPTREWHWHADGKGVPATVGVRIAQPGNFTIFARVTHAAADGCGYHQGESGVSVLAFHPAVPWEARPPAFFDGAEQGPSNWLREAHVAGAEWLDYPDEGRGWVATDVDAATGRHSWWTDSAPAYDGRMFTIVPNLPAGNHTFAFTYRAHPDATPELQGTLNVTLVAYGAAAAKWTSASPAPSDWTQVAMPFAAAGDLAIYLRYDQLAACPQACGFLLDDIVVA